MCWLTGDSKGNLHHKRFQIDLNTECEFQCKGISIFKEKCSSNARYECFCKKNCPQLWKCWQTSLYFSNIIFEWPTQLCRGKVENARVLVFPLCPLSSHTFLKTRPFDTMRSYASSICPDKIFFVQTKDFVQG